MLAQPDAIRALGLKWFHSSVYAHREPGRRCMACRRGFSSIVASVRPGDRLAWPLGSSRRPSRRRVRKSGPPETKAMQACRKFAPRAQAIEKN
jgi:hypothetical protein